VHGRTVTMVPIEQHWVQEKPDVEDEEYVDEDGGYIEGDRGYGHEPIVEALMDRFEILMRDSD